MLWLFVRVFTSGLESGGSYPNKWKENRNYNYLKALLVAMKNMDVENADMKAVCDGMVGLCRFAIIA